MFQPNEEILHLSGQAALLLFFNDIKRGTFRKYSSYSDPCLCSSHGSSANGTNTRGIIQTSTANIVASELVTIDHPISATINPKYCGFREMRYGPRRMSGPSLPYVDDGPRIIIDQSEKPIPPSERGTPNTICIHGGRAKLPQSSIPTTTMPIVEISKSNHIK